MWPSRWRGGLAAAYLLLSGCGSLRSELGLTDTSAVQTPAYPANKVLFLDPPKENPIDPADPMRYAPLAEGYEIAQRIGSGVEGTRRSVKNREPLSIVISKAYVPETLKLCVPRLSDIAFSKGRDIAVLLDVGASADKQEFIDYLQGKIA